VIRPDSGADVVVALLLSALFVMISLCAFTMLCWRVGADLGELPEMPLSIGSFSQRLFWLLIALLALVFAKLIDAFVKSWNSAAGSKKIFSCADELSAVEFDSLVAAHE
jgi:hypothetical protein